MKATSLMTAAACAVFVIGTTSAVGAVFKCTNAAGKTEYSDRPCASGESKSVAVPAPIPRDEQLSANLQLEANMGRVVVGMSPQQVQQAWGTPKTINADVRASGKHEQWVYERNGSDHYVYLDNGKVRSFSSHTSTLASTAAAAYQPAPSQRELDALERAEKAGERRHITNNSRLGRDQVEGRLGPPDNKAYRNGTEYWLYLPTPRDPQTRTVINFESSGRLIDIERTVQR
ncbi:MAG: DUF4124 domain-containing protein [Casimicrobiaceae bacterium]